MIEKALTVKEVIDIFRRDEDERVLKIYINYAKFIFKSTKSSKHNKKPYSPNKHRSYDNKSIEVFSPELRDIINSTVDHIWIRDNVDNEIKVVYENPKNEKVAFGEVNASLIDLETGLQVVTGSLGKIAAEPYGKRTKTILLNGRAINKSGIMRLVIKSPLKTIVSGNILVI